MSLPHELILSLLDESKLKFTAERLIALSATLPFGEERQALIELSSSLGAAYVKTAFLKSIIDNRNQAQK